MLSSPSRRPCSGLGGSPCCPPSGLVERAHAHRHLPPGTQHIESERTRQRHRFREPYLHCVAKLITKTGLFPRESLMGFVIQEIIRSECRYRNETISAKLRKREPMTQDEFDYASELVADTRSPLALAIPATLFCIGFFYVVGCLYELHVHGGNPSFRTFIGGIPMLTSMNMAAQLRRVARLQGKLRDVEVTRSEPADEITRT